jgi:DNA-binding response OmpR family regulator
MYRGQIMVIDDAPYICNMIETLLEGVGYDVTCFGKAREALMSLSNGTPDLIICDIVMPEMDGFEFRRALTEDRRTAHIPFCFLTAKDDMELMIEGMNAGVLDYFKKPISPKELLEHIDRIMDNLNGARNHLLDRILAEGDLSVVNFLMIERVLDSIKYTGKLILDYKSPNPLTVFYKRGRPVAANRQDGTTGHQAYTLADKMTGGFTVEMITEEITQQF